jgi:hypothetical protein
MWREHNESDVAMTTQQIDDLIRREREQSEVPDMTDDMPDDLEDDDRQCNCPSCRAQRQGLPPGLEQLMGELRPEDLMRALEQIIGGKGPKRRRGRSRPVFGDDDMPF